MKAKGIKEVRAEEAARVAPLRGAVPTAPQRRTGSACEHNVLPVQPLPQAPPAGPGRYGAPWRDKAAAMVGIDNRDRVEFEARRLGVTPWALLRLVMDRGLAAIAQEKDLQA